MPYTGDQIPSKKQLDKNGELIDPEDTLFENLFKMFTKGKTFEQYKSLTDDIDSEFEDLKGITETKD